MRPILTNRFTAIEMMQSKSVHLSVVNIGSCPSPLPKIFKLGTAAAAQICLEQKLVMKLLKIL